MRLAGVILVAIIAVESCGGADTAGPSEAKGTSKFTAQLDGIAWTASPTDVRNGAQRVIPGSYTIRGTDSTSGQEIYVRLYNIRGPGTYTLGVNTDVVGGDGGVYDGSSTWGTPESGQAGTISISKLTDSEIAATFSFGVRGVGVTSPASTRSVTLGAFDLSITGVPPDSIPDYAGTELHATIAGQPWTAASASANKLNDGRLVIGGGNDYESLVISLTNVTSPGVYTLSIANSNSRLLGVTVAAAQDTQNWISYGAGGSGTVTITSLTATRVKGTFAATLGPTPGTSTVGTITVSGSFDAGIDPF